MADESKPMVVRIPRKAVAAKPAQALQVSATPKRVSPPFSIPQVEPYEIQSQGPQPPDDAEMHLYTASSQSLSLKNMYKGSHGFLILSGPSLKNYDLSKLNGSRGIVTMGVNNSWSIFKPNLWISLDEPHYFLDAGWRDPSITKFVPLAFSNKNIGIKKIDGTFEKTTTKVNDLPAVFYFKRNLKFRVNQFLTEPTVNWGSSDGDVDEIGHHGARNIILSAIKMMYYLGFRKVYLLGADFKMEHGKPMHAFSQHITPENIAGHNASYAIINKRLTALAPVFAAADFQIFNCYKESMLTAFPYLSYEEAFQRASEGFSGPLNVEGWSDQYKIESSQKSLPARK